MIAAALEGVAEGKSLREVAEAQGISASTLNQWLLGEVPTEYRQLQQQGLIARIVDADGELDAATTHLDVAKAERKARFFRWDAERRLKHLFAQSHEITGAGGAPLVLDSLERVRRLQFLRSLDEAQPIDAEVIEAEQIPPPGEQPAATAAPILETSHKRISTRKGVHNRRTVEG